MNLSQFQYVCEIAKRGLNISAVASALDTNQPGISKQLKMLEVELGVEIFLRSKNRLSGITPHGQKIIALAQNVLNDIANIRNVGEEVTHESSGTIVLATTYTQSR